tara:strand:+ start:299 stop:613 length:315 start_codon:yes stop_codon:yes gene_type:complete
MKNNNEKLNILRIIEKKPKIKQRQIANELGFSLGKLNYCLRALKKKGLIKIKNFKNNKNKIEYLYLLTPKGINAKMNLTVNFLKSKSKEYEELQKELNQLGKNK